MRGHRKNATTITIAPDQLAKNMRAIRTLRGLSQAQAASRADIAPQTVVNYENPRAPTRPNLDKLASYCHAMGARVAQAIGEEPIGRSDEFKVWLDTMAPEDLDPKFEAWLAGIAPPHGEIIPVEWYAFALDAFLHLKARSQKR
jgi:transcriptional regulator with XRE-family HTH domain